MVVLPVPSEKNFVIQVLVFWCIWNSLCSPDLTAFHDHNKPLSVMMKGNFEDFSVPRYTSSFCFHRGDGEVSAFICGGCSLSKLLSYASINSSGRWMKDSKGVQLGSVCFSFCSSSALHQPPRKTENGEEHFFLTRQILLLTATVWDNTWNTWVLLRLTGAIPQWYNPLILLRVG